MTLGYCKGAYMMIRTYLLIPLACLFITGCGYVARVEQKKLNEKHAQESGEMAAKVARYDAVDALLLGVGSFFAGSVPGGAGLLVGLKKARAGYTNGEEVTSQSILDALAVAREADPEFDKAFDGKAGEILKSEMPTLIQELYLAAKAAEQVK
jgi:hypothetical protein